MLFSLLILYFFFVDIYLLHIKTRFYKTSYTADITLHTLRNHSAVNSDEVNVCKLHLRSPFTTSVSYTRVQVPRKIGTRSKTEIISSGTCMSLNFHKEVHP
jgi:hypothetical protein